jgi:hypothetical protein
VRCTAGHAVVRERHARAPLLSRHRASGYAASSSLVTSPSARRWRP